MTKDDTGIIIEYFDNKIEGLLEGAESLIDRKLAPIATDVAELKTDMKVVKAAVTATNEDVQDLKVRVSALEAA